MGGLAAGTAGAGYETTVAAYNDAVATEVPWATLGVAVGALRAVDQGCHFSSAPERAQTVTATHKCEARLSRRRRHRDARQKLGVLDVEPDFAVQPRRVRSA